MRGEITRMSPLGCLGYEETPSGSGRGARFSLVSGSYLTEFPSLSLGGRYPLRTGRRRRALSRSAHDPDCVKTSMVL